MKEEFGSRTTLGTVRRVDSATIFTSLGHRIGTRKRHVFFLVVLVVIVVFVRFDHGTGRGSRMMTKSQKGKRLLAILLKEKKKRNEGTILKMYGSKQKLYSSSKTCVCFVP